MQRMEGRREKSTHFHNFFANEKKNMCPGLQAHVSKMCYIKGMCLPDTKLVGQRKRQVLIDGHLMSSVVAAICHSPANLFLLLQYSIFLQKIIRISTLNNVDRNHTKLL